MPGAADAIQLREVGFQYPPRGGVAQKRLFRGLSFPVDCATRLTLVGPNGAGKSTLMKLLVGTLEATSGEVLRSNKIRTAMFTQHHVDQLDLSLTPLEYILQLARKTDPTFTPVRQ